MVASRRLCSGIEFILNDFLGNHDSDGKAHELFNDRYLRVLTGGMR